MPPGVFRCVQNPGEVDGRWGGFPKGRPFLGNLDFDRSGGVMKWESAIFFWE